MSNEIELTPDAIEDAMKFLSVPWLMRKELWSLDMARSQPTTAEAMIHEDEASRCRSTIIQLAHLRSETARLTAELERVEKERDALVKQCDDYELRIGQMARAQVRPQRDAALASMDKATATLESILNMESDTAKKLDASLTRAKSAEDRAGVLARAVKLAVVLMERIRDGRIKSWSAAPSGGRGYIAIMRDVLEGKTVEDWEYDELEAGRELYDAEKSASLTTPGDAGKGGG